MYTPLCFGPLFHAFARRLRAPALPQARTFFRLKSARAQLLTSLYRYPMSDMSPIGLPPKPVPIPQARTFFRLEPARALRIYDLLASCGWVNTGGQGAAGGPAGAGGGGGGGPLLLAGSGEVGAGASEGEVG